MTERKEAIAGAFEEYHKTYQGVELLGRNWDGRHEKPLNQHRSGSPEQIAEAFTEHPFWENHYYGFRTYTEISNNPFSTMFNPWVEGAGEGVRRANFSRIYYIDADLYTVEQASQRLEDLLVKRNDRNRKEREDYIARKKAEGVENPRYVKLELAESLDHSDLGKEITSLEGQVANRFREADPDSTLVRDRMAGWHIFNDGDQIILTDPLNNMDQRKDKFMSGFKKMFNVIWERQEDEYRRKEFMEQVKKPAQK